MEDHMELAMGHVMRLMPDQLRSIIAHAAGLHAHYRGAETTSRALLNVMGALDEQATLKRMDTIAQEVAFAHGLTLDELRAPSRFRCLVLARQEAMYRMRAVRWANGSHRYSLPQIGRYFGKDHTTVRHGIWRHAERAGLERLAA